MQNATSVRVPQQLHRKVAHSSHAPRSVQSGPVHPDGFCLGATNGTSVETSGALAAGAHVPTSLEDSITCMIKADHTCVVSGASCIRLSCLNLAVAIVSIS